MAEKVFQLNYAGHPLRYSFLEPATRYYMRPRPWPVEGMDPDVAASRELLDQVRVSFPEGTSDEYLEYRCMIGLTAKALLRYGCCVFHAAAFNWRGRAWLLTAPPETGKTTQYLNWQRLFPGEIAMISGDMPVLEGREDGSVWVHPSSWNGKEDLFGGEAAPLGGLVFLEQGPEDRIEPLSLREAVVPLLMQFMVVMDTEEEIRALAALLDRVLRAAPSWKMVNRGGDASTRLLRETLLAGMEKGAEN